MEIYSNQLNKRDIKQKLKNQEKVKQDNLRKKENEFIHILINLKSY